MQETRTAVPLRRPAGGRGKVPVANPKRECPLSMNQLSLATIPATGSSGSIPLKNSVLESIESELGLITGSFSLLVATIGAR